MVPQELPEELELPEQEVQGLVVPVVLLVPQESPVNPAPQDQPGQQEQQGLQELLVNQDLRGVPA